MDKTVEIVIMAMVAVFLGLRLYSVLGRRAEREERPRLEPKDAPRSAAPELAERPGAQAAPRALVPGDVIATHFWPEARRRSAAAKASRHRRSAASSRSIRPASTCSTPRETSSACPRDPELPEGAVMTTSCGHDRPFERLGY